MFSAKGKFTERLINILNTKGFLYWDILPSKEGFTAAMPIGEYKRLRRYLYKTGIKTRVEQRVGFPFARMKFKFRVGLLIGGVLFVALLFTFSKFIWITTVSGNKEIPLSKITQVLNKNGVHKGVYAKGINIKATERKIIKDLPDIRWISINITGSNAEVEIKEKYKSPKLMNKKQPCNVKSSRDGVVVQANVKEGAKFVKKGSAVIKGQLLISGVMEDEAGGSRLVHADGEIFGRTNYEKTYKLPKSRTMSVPTDNIKERNRGNILWLSFPMDYTHIGFESYKSITKEYCLTVNDVELPLWVTREYISELENKNIPIKNNKSALKVYSKLSEAFFFKNKQIENSSYTYRQDKKYYYLDVKYTVIEDLARKTKIIVN